MKQRTEIAADPPEASHTPVMLAEILEGLQIGAGAHIIDGTLGGGGHTAAFLAQSAPAGKVLGIDADPAAIRRNEARFAAELAAGRLTLVQGNFGEIHRLATTHGFPAVNAILLDLGVSSFQLETPERGFSFSHDGPLDMRFDPHRGMSAADVVNTWPERELADLIYQYGEERESRRIARYLVQHRPYTTTGQLAAAVERACGGRRGNRLHPATRSQLEHGAGGRIRLDKRRRLRVVDTEPVKQGGQTIAGAHALFANKLMGCGVEAGNLRGQIGHGQLFDQHRHGQIGSIR